VVPIGNLVAFGAIVTVLIAIPGPSVLFTISRALTVGRTAGLFTVVGNAIGEYVQVVAVALGVGQLLERSTEILTVVKLIGAAYLVYLGVQAIRRRGSIAQALNARMPEVGARRAVRDGFVVGLTNPKTIVFFVVALPQFSDPAAGPVVLQMLVLGALLPPIAVLLDSVWAVAAGTARQWFARSPRRLAAIGGTGGLVMIGLGLGLAVNGRKD
jgi:threonine/homoserine/homoserine lactone efflux protein